MNKVSFVAKKVPWHKVLKGTGTIMVGVGSVIGCSKTDENVAKMLKIIAAKVVAKKS